MGRVMFSTTFTTILITQLIIIGLLLNLHKLFKLERTIQTKMALDFKALTDAITQTTTVEQSAVTLITQIAQEIAVNAGDQATVSSLADQLNQQASALAAAITANTPAAPPSTGTTTSTTSTTGTGTDTSGTGQ